MAGTESVEKLAYACIARRVCLALIASIGLEAHVAVASEPGPIRAADGSVSEVAPRSRPLEVDILTRSENGLVFCALWSSAEGYPVDRSRAAYDGMSERLANRQAHIRFESIAHGEYALACFHDENSNHTLDTNFVGIPSEGTGASNQARGFMGPPRYEAARFVVTPRGPDALTIRIDY